MEFETVRIGNAYYAMQNGVMSMSCIAQISGSDEWGIFIPSLRHFMPTKEQALAFVIEQMDTWYTVTQAAERLVELGAYDAPPSAHTMSNLARAGAFPGAFKLRGMEAPGQGGQWRIPEAGLAAHTERRMKR